MLDVAWRICDRVYSNNEMHTKEGNACVSLYTLANGEELALRCLDVKGDRDRRILLTSMWLSQMCQPVCKACYTWSRILSSGRCGRCRVTDPPCVQPSMCFEIDWAVLGIEVRLCVVPF